MTSPRWLLVVVQLPTSPSRHRVAVWRDLRRGGAVPLAPGAWVLPANPSGSEAAARARALAVKGGGTASVFELDPKDADSAAAVAEAFTHAREEEWTEFLSECTKFQAEIAKEIAIEKFTLAELDEEEQSLARLRRWRRDLLKRDVLGSVSAEAGAAALRVCERDLEDYARRVYEAVQVDG